MDWKWIFNISKEIACLHAGIVFDMNIHFGFQHLHWIFSWNNDNMDIRCSEPKVKPRFSTCENSNLKFNLLFQNVLVAYFIGQSIHSALQKHSPIRNYIFYINLTVEINKYLLKTTRRWYVFFDLKLVIFAWHIIQHIYTKFFRKIWELGNPVKLRPGNFMWDSNPFRRFSGAKISHSWGTCKKYE